MGKSFLIPNRLIFIWIGRNFPLANQLAIKSAVDVCKPDEVLLIHEGLKEDMPELRELVALNNLTLCEANDSWFDNTPLGGETARHLYRRLSSPTIRANLLRMAVLWKLGGIYLDMDTVTVKNFDQLRSLYGFCGTEHVALPGNLFHSKNPFRWVVAGVRLAFRECCVRIPYGYKLFRAFEGLYDSAVNNAVIGSVPKNPIWQKAFLMIEQMSEAERVKPFRMGTHLMQNITQNRSSEWMQVLKPAWFYPLGPEISTFWFKGGYARKTETMVQKETLVIHWYNSVELRFIKQHIDTEYLQANTSSPFYKLVEKYL